MSIPSSLTPLFNSGSSGGALQVSRSLRFNAADTAYLSRTPAVAGNRKKFTMSFWVKRTSLDGGTGPGDHSALFSAGNWTSDSDTFTIVFLGSGSGAGINIGFLNFGMNTNATFRDLSAWYHFVCAVDTDQAVLNDRIKFYQNGIDLNLAVSASVTQGLSTAVNNTVIQAIGKGSGGNFYYLNGYLANFHIIDGQQLTPASFAETDATTGAWNPKTYTGSYGTNGFNLLFADNSSNTASTLGKDTSGLGNNFTPNNLSVTAGAGNDSLVDFPVNGGTDTGVGGEVRGNYATWNPLASASSSTLSNGNLDAYTGTTFPGTVSATFGMSTGKWYWEITFSGSNYGPYIGIKSTAEATTSYPGQAATSYSWYSEGSSYSKKYNNSTAVDYSLGVGFTLGDIIGVAFDADTGSLEFYKNGTSQGVAFTGISAGTYVAAVADGTNAGGPTLIGNFGQRAFAYTAPSGFKALCTQNLPAALVTKSNTVFDIALWTGTGVARSITGLAFNPDLVWVKQRSGVNNNQLFDSVRGVSNTLQSDVTLAEVIGYAGVTAFNSDGFDLGTVNGVNGSSSTYVGWAWDAGTSTVSNTQGSITSQVRANATAGFSVVTYTGNLSSSGTSTVGHGLGVAPKMIIFKRRDGTSDWAVQHSGLPSANNLLSLNLTAATSTSGYGTIVAPTSTVFTVAWLTGMGVSGQTHVAYCFAPIIGHSSFGSYTGNGSSDGPFIYTGFRPKFFMHKDYTVGGAGRSWLIWDAARETYNAEQTILFANDSAAESSNSGHAIDFVSNGIKIRNDNININPNGVGFVYMAFAESPFNYSRAR